MPETNPLGSALRRRLIIFLVLGGCCVIALAAGLLLRKYAGSLSMPKGKAESRAMQTTVNEMETSLKRLKGLLPVQLTVRAGEERIYAVLDALRVRYRNADIKVEGLQERGDELVMPVRINFKGITYSALVQEIGYLQSLRFPFFEITDLTLGGDQGAGSVTCGINGTLQTFKPPAQANK